jgi:hypothetical protein
MERKREGLTDWRAGWCGGLLGWLGRQWVGKIKGARAVVSVLQLFEVSFEILFEFESNSNSNFTQLNSKKI